MPKPPLLQIAASLDAPPALAPHIAALFADLSALGSMPHATARMLAGAGLRPHHHILDLACGKGAVAVELAARAGCRVTALDAYPPFIEAARTLAARRNVSHLCTFRVANLRDPQALPRSPFDAAVMLGLDPLERAAPLVRSFLKPGGLYAVDDCHRDPRHPRARRFESIPTRDQRRSFVESLGDSVLTIDTPAPAAIRRLNNRLYRALARRAAVLGREHPPLRPHLREFLKRQREANAILTGPLRPALWIIRRARTRARR